MGDPPASSSRARHDYHSSSSRHPAAAQRPFGAPVQSLPPVGARNEPASRGDGRSLPSAPIRFREPWEEHHPPAAFHSQQQRLPGPIPPPRHQHPPLDDPHHRRHPPTHAAPDDFYMARAPNMSPAPWTSDFDPRQNPPTSHGARNPPPFPGQVRSSSFTASPFPRAPGDDQFAPRYAPSPQPPESGFRQPSMPTTLYRPSSNDRGWRPPSPPMSRGIVPAPRPSTSKRTADDIASSNSSGGTIIPPQAADMSRTGSSGSRHSAHSYMSSSGLLSRSEDSDLQFAPPTASTFRARSGSASSDRGFGVGDFGRRTPPPALVSSNTAKKRSRAMMNRVQQSELRAMWKNTKFPTNQDREELSKKIGLTSRQVQVWFQNQRQKFRKELAEHGVPDGADPADYADLDKSPRTRRLSLDGGDEKSGAWADSTATSAGPSRAPSQAPSALGFMPSGVPAPHPPEPRAANVPAGARAPFPTSRGPPMPLPPGSREHSKKPYNPGYHFASFHGLPDPYRPDQRSEEYFDPADRFAHADFQTGFSQSHISADAFRALDADWDSPQQSSVGLPVNSPPLPSPGLPYSPPPTAEAPRSGPPSTSPWQSGNRRHHPYPQGSHGRNTHPPPSHSQSHRPSPRVTRSDDPTPFHTEHASAMHSDPGPGHPGSVGSAAMESRPSHLPPTLAALALNGPVSPSTEPTSSASSSRAGSTGAKSRLPLSLPGVSTFSKPFDRERELQLPPPFPSPPSIGPGSMSTHRPMTAISMPDGDIMSRTGLGSSKGRMDEDARDLYMGPTQTERTARDREREKERERERDRDRDRDRPAREPGTLPSITDLLR